MGGSARYFVKVHSDEQVVEAFEFAMSKGVDLFVLGGGSNILVSDEGFDGLVVHIASKGITFQADVHGGNTVQVTAQAGEDWDGFVSFCV